MSDNSSRTGTLALGAVMGLAVLVAFSMMRQSGEADAGEIEPLLVFPPSLDLPAMRPAQRITTALEVFVARDGCINELATVDTFIVDATDHSHLINQRRLLPINLARGVTDHEFRFEAPLEASAGPATLHLRAFVRCGEDRQTLNSPPYPVTILPEAAR